MKKKYAVEWAKPAKLDLFEIADFIAADSPANALRISDKIKKKTADLQMNPERGRVVPELSKHGITAYRELVVSPWRVIYRIVGKKVYIKVVADGRRNLEDLLFRRLMR
jgi:plasmid stabilization system protein ParE